MPEIKLYAVNGTVAELPSRSVGLEKELQTLIENNMEAFFGVTFLQSEFSIANGRIDSLGLDENYCPVIFEYKRSVNENVINQGLFYLNWLLDHKADFVLLVLEKLGKKAADLIDWSMPCVMCIANDFTKFDEHAVNQMQRNIKLVRYKKYDGLLLFEHLNAPAVKPNEGAVGSVHRDKTFVEKYEAARRETQALYCTVRDYILSLGDNVTDNQLKLYVAFRKTKNFASAEISANRVILTMKLDPDTVQLVDGLVRDVRNIGHWGSGNLQALIGTAEDFEAVKPLILRAYEEN